MADLYYKKVEVLNSKSEALFKEALLKSEKSNVRFANLGRYSIWFLFVQQQFI